MSSARLPPIKKQKVFLTGVTGFVGRYLLYLLCDAEWVDDIYVLIRPKREKTPEDRLADVLTDPLFVKARELGTKFDNIHCVPGDLLEPRLGMSEDSVELLSKIITLVIHNAAALSFAATLQDGLKHNTTPTWILYNMCKDRFQLKPSFIWVSTIATNSHLPVVPEKVTPWSSKAKIIYEHVTNMDLDVCIRDVEELKEGRLDGYAFSKGIGESMILEDVEENGSQIPIYFVRPGGIISTLGGPLPNWMHGTCFYGQLGYYVYTGKILMFLCNKDVDCNMAPVDLVSNLIMCCCLDATEKREDPSIKQYGCQVVNGSKPMIEGVSFGVIFKNVRTNYDECFQLALSLEPEIQPRGCPWEPIYLQSAWLFSLIFNVFVSFPLFIYSLFVGSSSVKYIKLHKLMCFVYKYIKVLAPYVSKQINVENGYCDVLQEKYGNLYPIESDIDRDAFVALYLRSLATYIVPPLERKELRLRKKWFG